MLISHIVLLPLLHDNGLLALEHCWNIFIWELYDHLLHSPDLTLSDYHLFPLPEELFEITVLE
jgi:hypothetical protein